MKYKKVLLKGVVKLNYTLLALTGLPLLGTVLCSVISDRVSRNAVIVALSVAIMAFGGYLGYFMLTNQVSVVFKQSPEFIEKIAWGMFVLELALLFYVIWRGFLAKRYTSPALALIQLGALFYLKFYVHPHYPTNFINVDNLSLILTLLVSIIGPMILIFSIGYMKEHEEHLHLEKSKQPQFFAIIFFFLFAMNSLAICNNISWVYAFWEMTTLCSFLLIQHDKTHESIRNAFKTLDLNMLGGVAFVIGIIFIYQVTGTTSLSEICGMRLDGNNLLAFAIVLLCIAGFTKSAQFPFQRWLLGAMVAPTPVSALLHSSTMVKAGVYLVLRMAPVISGTMVGNLVAVAGGFTFLAAAVLAVSQSNGKKVLAYSTISNLGLIICLAGIGNAASIAAAIFLMIFHAVSKGMLFLAVGTIEQKIGSRDIEDMQGMLKIMPFTTFILSIGIVSMLLPPFGVLITKWIAIEAAVKFPLVLVFIVLGSAFTIVFWAKWLGIISTSSYKKDLPKEKIMPGMKLILSVLFAMVILVSAFIDKIYDALVRPAVVQMLAYAQESNVFSLTLNSVQSGIMLADGNNFIVGGFVVLPMFIIMLILALVVPLTKVHFAEIRPPYFGGELANNDIRGIEFMGPGEKVERVVVRNYYFNNMFSEEKLSIILMAIASVIILIMLGVVL